MRIGSRGVISSPVPHHPAYGSVQGGSDQTRASFIAEATKELLAVTVFAEIRLEKRTQHLCDGLLDHAIQHRRDSQRAFRPVGLRNPHPFDGRGPVVSFSDRNGNPRPVSPRERGKVLNGHAIDPRSTRIPVASGVLCHLDAPCRPSIRFLFISSQL